MFSLLSRGQAVVNQSLTASAVAAALVVFLSILQLFKDDVWSIDTSSISNIKANASLKNSFAYGAVGGKPKENSKIQFDLDADLTSLFNWNTKQVFVYLTAEYEGKTDKASNKVTYWDKIITSPEDAVLHLKNQRSKYSVWDVERSFRGRDATLRLEWNIQPWVGPLLYGSTTTESTFTFPEVKKPKKKSE
ncbi:hypothetical protein CA3LBN_002434 [Candidozyma haemuli]|uniref:Signal peptidase subunit 3 n=1 Tax=Candidozyma haemuli TaxID=45357 RepID=A0ABX8I4V6_9ASCO|nr:hypothetical protein CA3LBN_002434 [[Candida] haemuloni]